MPSKKSARAGERGAAAIGDVIADKYKVLKVLGQGGFGTVYLVEITAGMVGEKLALKLLSEEFSGNETVREQFLNEIRVAMKMVDRYIVQIRDVGTTTDGRVYYTMDYCPGRTLASILSEERRLPWRRALLIVLKVLRALRTAHSRGIIHRDLKPANIMVEVENGRESVRVLDFGIATVLRGPDSERGGISGSPLYMPPEQFLGEKLGLYTDLYAVGAILYECLTGERPYPGRSAKEIFDGLKRGPPIPPDELNPELVECPGLSAVVMRALERNPERRFQTPKEFFDELGGFLSEETPTEPPTRAAASSARRPARPRLAGRRLARRRAVGPWILLFLVLAAAGVVAFTLRDELGLDLSKILPSLGPTEAPPLAGSGSVTPEPPESPTPDPAPTDSESPEAVGDPQEESANGHVGTTTATNPSSTAPDSTADSTAPSVETRNAPDLDELLAAAEEAFEESEWNRVFELAGKVLEHRSGDGRALRLLGKACARLDRLEDAERHLEKARRDGPDDPVLLLELATVKTRKKPPEWAAAERLLEAARRTEDAQGGYESEAISSLLARALEKQNKRQELRHLLIRTKERKRDFPGFETYWKELLVDAPAAMWAEAKKEGEAARQESASGNAASAVRSARQALRLTEELEEFGPYASVEEAKALALEMSILAAEISISRPRGAGLDPATVADLLRPVSRLIKKSPQALSPKLVMKWNYLSGRLQLLLYDKEPKGSVLNAAESYLNEARRLMENEDRRERDEDLLAAVHSWLARVYAHRADHDRVSEHLKDARDVKDLGEIYEQARTYFLTGTKTRGEQRIESYQSAADRLENITNLPSTRVQAELYAASLDLLGQCYLMLGRYEEKQRRFVYAANKFVEARNEGLRTPELYRNLGAAYEEFNRIKAAQTYRELYEQIQPSLCNCLLAAETYIRATENTREARNIVSDGLNRFRGKERTTLERALRAIEATRSHRSEDNLVGEIEKLRRIACK